MTGESPMPNPNNARDGLVEVIQADREAAARVVLAARLSLRNLVAAEMREGHADDHVMVQEFARHRLDATRLAASDADREGVREALMVKAEQCDRLAEVSRTPACFEYRAKAAAYRDAASMIAALASATTPTPPGDDALRAALEMFVKHYQPWMDDQADNLEMSCFARVTYGDVRRARTVLRSVDAEAGRG